MDLPAELTNRPPRAPGHGPTATLTLDAYRRLKEELDDLTGRGRIDIAEKIRIAREHGLNGVMVSNHGGRGEDSGRGAIEALPEVVEGVRGRIPVLVDSGFRRGTDVVKALAMGATAAGIGRPYLWGLGAFGQAGVERVLELNMSEVHAAVAAQQDEE